VGGRRLHSRWPQQAARWLMAFCVTKRLFRQLPTLDNTDEPTLLGPGLRNLWRACPTWRTVRFLWQAAFTAASILFFLPDQRLYIVKNMCMYIYKHIWLRRLRMNYRCYQIIWCVRLTTLPPSCAVVMKSGNLNFLELSGLLQACNGTALPLPLPLPNNIRQVKHFYTNRKQCEVLTGYSSSRHRRDGGWANVSLEKTSTVFFTNSSSSSSSTRTSTLSSLSHSSRRRLLEIQSLYFT